MSLSMRSGPYDGDWANCATGFLTGEGGPGFPV